jgi:hypothetical protein
MIHYYTVSRKQSVTKRLGLWEEDVMSHQQSLQDATEV